MEHIKVYSLADINEKQIIRPLEMIHGIKLSWTAR